jgi:hypothetical protein
MSYGSTSKLTKRSHQREESQGKVASAQNWMGSLKGVGKDNDKSKMQRGISPAG